jgi:hypothetical protein
MSYKTTETNHQPNFPSFNYGLLYSINRMTSAASPGPPALVQTHLVDFMKSDQFVELAP